MANFTVKLKRTILDKKGNDKEICETFFVENAVSFGDAETKVQTYWNCECDVVAVAISKVMEVLNYPTQEEKESLNVFKATLNAIFTDEDDVEKETKYNVLVWSANLEQAMDYIAEYIKQGYTDMNLVALNKTKIVEVI